MSLKLTLTLFNDAEASPENNGTNAASAQDHLNITPTRILSGQEAVSSLYAYDILVKTAEEPDTILTQLGKRISLHVQEGERVLHSLYGVVMSIESTLSYTTAESELTEAGKELSWYKWTIRPALAKACYSRNRLVYSAKEIQNIDITGIDKTAAPAEKLLHLLVSRWGSGDLSISSKAKSHLPAFIQLVQNDESDYNFFSRLLAAWGLAYVWTMPAEEQGAVPKEKLCIFDAVEADREPFTAKGQDEAPAVMVPVSSRATLWKANYGIRHLKQGEIALQNYNQGSTDAAKPASCAVLYSLHDDTWDQLSSAPDAKRLLATLQAARSHGSYCRGHYRYPNGSEAFQALAVGHKIKWKNGTHPQCRPSAECVNIRQTITATDKSWAVTIEGMPADSDPAIGLLPRPVQTEDRPGLSDSPLQEAASWPEPRMRCFLAVVEDASCYGDESSRNLCKVREIAAWGAGEGQEAQLSNTLWVEMASPYADKNSGLLARPRKGNVLVCLDRGDLSIPIALTSLFRDSNAAPLARLKTLNRRTRQKADSTTDLSAVTLRNRTHLPERTYTDPAAPSGQEIDLEVESAGSPNGTTEAEAATRPMSVTDLAAKPLPFSQIQLIALDNGVKPVEQSEHITNTYLSSSIVETVMGFVSEADSSGGYAMANAAQDAQEIYNSPATRPHFEGVNIYSNSDVLLQSADHQIINAGGEIVVTAAQGITLRVGKSSVRITEAGIQITSATGKVLHPGAYPAYNTADDSQATHLLSNAGLPMSGSILVDSSGVVTKGPYITSIATNQVKSSTVLGSVFAITDFSAKLYAPEITVIGGATIQDTVFNGVINGALAIKDYVSTAGSSDAIYSGTLQDGWKTAGLTTLDFAGSAVTTVKQALGWLGALSFTSKLSSLVSVTGSMVKLNATSMTQSSPQIWNYNNHLIETNTPLAGFFAMSERASMSNIIKKIPTNSWMLAGIAAGGASLAGAFGGSAFGGSKDSPDSFTKPNATDRPKTASFKSSNGLGSSIGAGVGLALGAGAAGLTALLDKKTTEQVMNKLANLCYLSKRNLTLGMEEVQTLKSNQTTLQAEIDAVDKQELALKNDSASASASDQSVVASSDSVSASERAVSDASEVVSDVSSSVSQSEQTLSATQQAALSTASDSLATTTGTQLNV